MSNREVDINGYTTIKKNPISKVGVFPYPGKNIDPGLEPEKVYWVYRPAEELCKPETIESFKYIPIIDDHTMLGKGATPAERKGVDGVTGADVVQEGDYLFADLHIYSDTLRRKIDKKEKKDISIGYRVGRWEPCNGTFNDMPYDFIQRDLRGNHVAVVQEGRSGKDVAVLDGFTYDHMDIVIGDEMIEDGGPNEVEILYNWGTARAVKRKVFKSQKEAERWIDSNEGNISNVKWQIGENVKDTASDSTASPAADKEGDAEQPKKGANDMAEKDEEKKGTSMDDVKAFMKQHAKDRKTFDKLMDEMRPAEDAAEEKEDKKAEDADTEEKPGDQKAEDADEEKKAEDAEEEKKAMDSAIKGLRTEIADLKKNGIKTLMGELNKRNEVAKTVEAQFGTFDHAELTASEVAAYGLKKAGMRAPAGAEIAVWDAYAAGRKASGATQVKAATDSKDKQAPVGSLIEKTLHASK